ncbi:hypothetical protein GCM10009646_71210 [Streptomyces aureus]
MRPGHEHASSGCAHSVLMVNQMRITVVRGLPDEAELAAVTAVLLALVRRAGEPDDETKAAYAGWTVKGGGHVPRAIEDTP